MPDQEKGLLVFTPHDDDATPLDIKINELRALAMTAQVDVVEEVIQRRRGQRRLPGKGKSEEIAQTVKAQDIDVVIFDGFLSPSQTRNMEDLLGTKVIDRAALILDIFAQRATSKEGQLQVEMAQLSYLLPRLSGQGKALSRLGGGVGTRGPGETQLETDRRHIRRRLHHVKLELQDVVRAREIQRAARRRLPVPYVVLVGYTNAGKSSLLNALAKDDIYVADQLFATLDPTTRRIQTPSGAAFFISDTVGFIRDLPPQLTIAFKATLEIVKEADLLLHVVDVSESGYEERAKIVDGFLKDLGADEIPKLVVANKMDRCSQDVMLSPYLAKQHPIYTSTLDETGVQNVFAALERYREEKLSQVLFILANDAVGAKALALAHQTGNVRDVVYETDTLRFTLFYHGHLPGALEKYLSPSADGKDYE